MKVGENSRRRLEQRRAAQPAGFATMAQPLDDLVELGLVAQAGDPRTVGDVVVNRFRKRIRFLKNHPHAPAEIDHVHPQLRVLDLVKREDGNEPMSDSEIVEILSERGIPIARRTVAKYREDLRIPSTHQRRVKA